MNESLENKLTNLKFKFVGQPEMGLSQVKQPLVIINFWASWCLPCVKEFVGINQLIDKFGKDKVFVLGINNDVEDPDKQIKKSEEKYQLKFSSVPDLDGRYTTLFGVENIPYSIVLYKGKLIKLSEGEFDFSNPTFLAEIKDYLSK